MAGLGGARYRAARLTAWLALLRCGTSAPEGRHAAGAPPLLVLNAAAVHTMDPSSPAPEAFCVGVDGRFAAVGARAEAAAACGETASVLDLNGAIVLPGLIDSHSHLLDEGRRLSVADLASARSAAEAASIAAAFAHSHKLPESGWVSGFGWDQNDWPGGAFPTRADLDRVLPDVPVYLDRIDGHAAWVNSVALRLAGIGRDTPDPEGGRIVRDAQGEPTGVLVDKGKELVTSKMPPPSAADREFWIKQALRECAALGLTSAHDMGADPAVLQLYRQAAERHELSLRLHAFRLGADEPGMGRGGSPSDPKLVNFHDTLSIGGVKFFMDGALGSWGAAMLENYTDRPELSGRLRFSEADFTARVRPWAAAGWQVATHAIGDRANRVVLDAYEAALTSLNLTASDHRFRVEHAQILAPSDLPRFAPLGVLPSMQPGHATADMRYAEQRLGARRLQDAYAWKSVLESGVRRLPFGSDFPTAGVVNPFWGIHAAVTRQDHHKQPPGGWYPSQRVSVERALRGYTMDAAFAARAEAMQGSITKGKYGDFVVIDRDILKVDPSEIWSTKVLGTYLGGRRVDAGNSSGMPQPGCKPVYASWILEGQPYEDAGPRPVVV